MKRLIGILDNDSRARNLRQDRLLVHDGNRIMVSDRFSVEGKPEDEEFEAGFFGSNSDLINDRNHGVGKQEVFGDGVFDFRYGPVTSGVMESGVYHLYTYGERILCVNIDWSYKHRGIEKSVIGLDGDGALTKAEEICGNFAFSHSLAFAKAIESAIRIEVSPHVRKLRIIALELERIYNHIYVITQLASAAAQKVMTSHLQAIYEDLLRLNKDFSGSRFLKGLNGIASMKKSMSIDELTEMSQRVNSLSNRFEYLYERALESENFMDRLHDTAKLTPEKAIDIGVTGPTLRATGVREDFRLHDPDYEGLRCTTSQMGDSLARMEVRAEEIFESAEIISDIVGELKELKESGVEAVVGNNENDFEGAGVGYCESPSGLLAYHVEIEKGRLSSVYAATPSLFGFKAITESLVGNIFTDFPFAVDSFGAYFSDAAR